MTPKEFYDNVVRMRRHQKEYFKTRSTNALNASKQYERIVDAEIERVEEIMQRKLQPTLFDL